LELTPKKKEIPIDTVNINTEFKIYPNPTNKVLNIEIPASCMSDLTAKIYNLSGQLMITVQIPGKSKQMTIDINGMPKGYYNLRIENDRSLVFSGSFIKL
jgi:hypothetical protein